jgi:hypothetical protein
MLAGGGSIVVAGGQSLPRRERAAADTGPGSRAARIAMAYKLIDAAQARRRAVNAPHLVALVRASADVQKQTAAATHQEQSETIDGQPSNRRIGGR